MFIDRCWWSEVDELGGDGHNTEGLKAVEGAGVLLWIFLEDALVFFFWLAFFAPGPLLSLDQCKYFMF